MFNVAVIRLKDIIKYLVALIVIVIIFFMAKRYFFDRSEIDLGQGFMGSLLCRAGSFFCSFLRLFAASSQLFILCFIVQIPSYCADFVIPYKFCHRQFDF